MIAKFTNRVLLVLSLSSISCVGGYEGASDDDDSDDDNKSLNAADSCGGGAADAGTWDAGKSSSAPDAGKAWVDSGSAWHDSGSAWAADSGSTSWGDAGSKDAGHSDGGAGGGSCSALTYASFGQQFLTSYCVGCHGSTLVSGGVRLDSLSNLQSHKAAVKSAVADGTMPQGSKKPTSDERTQLENWIDCGAN
ncbi:MAG TPA: hypothetical protein VG963_16340 [Polyangiaceae bacterium]|nr:hypothetical protein [Polyangiaceae bacterium]